MQILERIYRTPIGCFLSWFAHKIGHFHKPFMIYGHRNTNSNIFLKYTRMSSTVTVMNRRGLTVADNVWVWHYTILDATEGIEIEEGAQIGAWVGIFTHGSENSIRLLGKNFVHIPNASRKGYTRGKVRIGAYSFIGARSTILPGVSIGKGCIVAAGSIVSKSIPDYSIFVGNQVVDKSTIDKDKRFFDEDDFSSTYYDIEALSKIKENIKR